MRVALGCRRFVDANFCSRYVLEGDAANAPLGATVTIRIPGAHPADMAEVKITDQAINLRDAIDELMLKFFVALLGYDHDNGAGQMPDRRAMG
jgi:hypothetical protein